MDLWEVGEVWTPAVPGRMGGGMCGRWVMYGSNLYLAGWEMDVWEVGEVWEPPVPGRMAGGMCGK